MMKHLKIKMINYLILHYNTVKKCANNLFKLREICPIQNYYNNKRKVKNGVFKRTLT